MKRAFIPSLIMILQAACACYAVDKSSHNPGILLNPQDVPIFYDNSPLTGIKSFTVIISLPLNAVDMQKKIEGTTEKALGAVGQVIRLKDDDMRGFGAGSVLIIQVGSVATWDGNEMPASRLSLSIETPVTLDKTGIKTFPMVWSTNTFLQGSANLSSESTLTKAVQKLVGDFVQSYQYANQDQPKNPVFYMYD